MALNRRNTRCLGSLKLAAAGGQVSRIQFVFYQPLKYNSFRETEVTEEAGCSGGSRNSVRGGGSDMNNR